MWKSDARIRVLAALSVMVGWSLTSCGGADGASEPTKPIATTLTLSPINPKAHPNDTVTITAAATDQNGKPVDPGTVLWTSSDPRVVGQIGETGRFLAVQLGTATINAVAGTLSASTTLTVIPIPFVSARLSQPSQTILVGSTLTIAMQIIDSVGTLFVRPATWSSSNPSIAIVDGNGNVTANSVGVATITATADGFTASAVITVQAAPVANITITAPSNRQLYEGDTIRLTAKATDASGLDVPASGIAWSSSAPQIASVSSTGLLTVLPGKLAGSTIVTVTASTGGKSAARTLPINEWALVQSTSTSPARTGTLVLNADPLVSTEPMTISIQCQGATHLLFVSTSSVTANGFIGYRLANRGLVTETWLESAPFFRSLSYPREALNFAGQLSTSDSLFFAYNRFLGGSEAALFITRGLSQYIPKLQPFC